MWYSLAWNCRFIAVVMQQGMHVSLFNKKIQKKKTTGIWWEFMSWHGLAMKIPSLFNLFIESTIIFFYFIYDIPLIIRVCNFDINDWPLLCGEHFEYFHGSPLQMAWKYDWQIWVCMIDVFIQQQKIKFSANRHWSIFYKGCQVSCSYRTDTLSAICTLASINSKTQDMIPHRKGNILLSFPSSIDAGSVMWCCAVCVCIMHSVVAPSRAECNEKHRTIDAEQTTRADH